MVGGTLVVNMFINFWLTIPTLVLIVVHVIIFRMAMPTIRAAKRLEMIAGSPILSHLDTTVNGLSTIRAFQRGRHFEQNFWDILNRHTSTCFLNFCAIRWMNIAIDSSCALYVCIIIILLVKSDFSRQGGSNIGLAISMTLILNRNVQSVVRCCIDTASYMCQVWQIIAVERLLEYADLPDKEAQDPPEPPPQGWPDQGAVEFRHVYLRYKPEDEPVLKDVCLRFRPGEKVNPRHSLSHICNIGVVGRTGAGKSSLIASLFRLAEPTGKVVIDGVATSDVGLKQLRRSISIIPQTPFLFTTSLRQNLDLFGDHDDKILWDVLQEVQLKSLVSGLAGGLDFEIPEGGGSLSLGQRQLVCLARALLRRNRLLVLDEATANLDSQTDSLIQKTIRDKFASCTVLTIAHRLQTIMDSDRILVMSDGKVAQFDTPTALLDDEAGPFAQMVRDNGPSMARQLALTARKAAMKRQNAVDARHPSIDEERPLAEDDPCTKL
ncbi:ABCC4 [Cordylochernes scorpioides]|uniref:ABCC4 n=1 Tax=Cordylochernes scorpioides TaxID=51811 RepID=A0ABY6KQA0_9ARAC|nr:ABCC4 [Cordylochernes scorpioides]